MRVINETLIKGRNAEAVTDMRVITNTGRNAKLRMGRAAAKSPTAIAAPTSGGRQETRMGKRIRRGGRESERDRERQRERERERERES